jgi:hypothetical protein
LSTILFGTVEYYEREILDNLAIDKKSSLIREDATLRIISMLEYEISNTFSFDEITRVKCFRNLIKAFCVLSEKVLVTS